MRDLNWINSKIRGLKLNEGEVIRLNWILYKLEGVICNLTNFKLKFISCKQVCFYLFISFFPTHSLSLYFPFIIYFSPLTLAVTIHDPWSFNFFILYAHSKVSPPWWFNFVHLSSFSNLLVSELKSVFSNFFYYQPLGMSSFFYRPSHGFISSLPSQQRRSSLPSPLPHDTRLQIFAFVIPLFVSFIPLKYLNTDFNPHATHPRTMRAFIYISIVFCVSSIAEAKFNRVVDNIYGLVFGHISEFAAILAVMLLASIGFPDPLTWFDYIALVFILMCSFLSLLAWLRRWLYEKTRKAVQFALECLCGLMMGISVRYHRLLHHDCSTLLPITSTSISRVRTPWCYFNFMLKNHCSNKGFR